MGSVNGVRALFPVNGVRALFRQWSQNLFLDLIKRALTPLVAIKRALTPLVGPLWLPRSLTLGIPATAFQPNVDIPLAMSLPN